MTLTMTRQTYGVQVGNEIYSVVATDEDWEKRRLERERQKRLSQETNRRRKALEEKKKVAEEREARKRALQLSKRKQRQTEATEKYQRAHISVKQGNKMKDKNNPNLDDVLQQLRSGSSKGNNGALNTDSETSSLQSVTSQVFEETAREKQQRLLQEHKLHTKKEFFNEIGRQFAPASNIRNNQPDLTETSESYLVGDQHSHQRGIYSNFNLMSGQTGYHSIVNRDYTYSPENIASMFSNHIDSNQNPSLIDDINKLQLEDADDVIQSPFVNPIKKTVYDFPSNSTSVQVSSSSPNQESCTLVLNSQQPDTSYQDDQDSLHGSSSSGTSPILSTMTSFHKKYAGDDLQGINDSSKKDPQLSLSSPIVLTHTSTPNNSTPYSSYLNITTSPVTDVTYPINTTYTLSSNYYLKSYRPSTAVEPFNDRQDSSSKPRAKSATACRTSTTESSVFQHDNSVISTSSSPTSIRTNAAPVNAWVKPSESSAASKISLSTSSSHSTVHTSTSLANGDRILSKSLTAKPPLTENKAHKLQSPSVNSAPQRNDLHKSIQHKQSDNLKQKGILRKVSKYDTPHYHNAAAAARQKWVEHINATSGVAKTQTPSQSAKLQETVVRDSLEINRNDRPKSVRWHQIHYDDGTSVTLTEPNITRLYNGQFKSNSTAQVIIDPARNIVDKSTKSRPLSARPRKPPQDADRSMKKSPKGSKNRKLKLSTKLQVALNPHPPPVRSSVRVGQPSNSGQSSKVSSMKQQDSSLTSSKESQQKLTPYRMAWVGEEKNVTLDTLKSCGSPPLGASIKQNNSTISPKIMPNSPQPTSISNTQENGVEQTSPTYNLSKTPTDQEINWLWDKVRSCIAQRPMLHGNPISKTISDTGNRTIDRRTSNRQPSLTQPRATVVSIDGGMFADQVVQSRNRRPVRPSSAVMATAKQRLNAYNASIRRQALLQHRRNKQFAPNRMKNDLITGPRRYPTPRMSYFDPFPSPSSRSKGTVDESTTAFLLAETLAEQNMSEDEILKAMDSLQRKTAEAQSHKQSVNPTSLSIEEHRLLKSLERLNSRLLEVESAVSTNPNVRFFDYNQMPIGGFYSSRGYSPNLIHHRRASARY